MAVEPLACSAVLTHHWLVRRRGGEKVLEAIAELLLGAEVYTLVCAREGIPAGGGARRDSRTSEIGLAGRVVHTSILQHVPGALRHYPKLLPLMPWAARRMRLPPVDLVVCSDAAIAKAMTVDRRSRLVCYCHSPMRYVWEPEISAQYAATLPAVLRPMWPGLCARLRDADFSAAQRVDRFIANSKTVAERVRRCYGREATVVYPPVELADAPTGGLREDFYLCVGHHVAYKRLDLAVAACRRMGRRLVVIGDGPDVARLAAAGIAGASGPDEAMERVRFLGHQSDAVVQEHYRRARGLLFPGEEDFGIVPVEAIAHGCPVIAYGRGGAAETVIDGASSVLFEPQSVEALCNAIERFESIEFDAIRMHESVRRFSRARFLQELRGILIEEIGSVRGAK